MFFDHRAFILVFPWPRERRVMFLSMRPEVNPHRAQQQETSGSIGNTAQLAIRVTPVPPNKYGRNHAATSIWNCVRGLLCTIRAPGTTLSTTYESANRCLRSKTFH